MTKFTSQCCIQTAAQQTLLRFIRRVLNGHCLSGGSKLCVSFETMTLLVVVGVLNPRTWSHVLQYLNTSDRIEKTSYKQNFYCRTPELPETNYGPIDSSLGSEVFVCSDHAGEQSQQTSAREQAPQPHNKRNSAFRHANDSGSAF